jgi:SAM-dependent methyltransferase
MTSSTTSGPLRWHPLAYVLGLEGVALMRAFAGEHDAAFIDARVAEVRALAADPARLGDVVVLEPLSAVEAYDGWAPSYDGPNTMVDMEEPVLRPLLDALPPGDAIDAACGTGRHAAHLAERGHRVRGYDSSPGMLEVAAARHPSVAFGLADLADLPVVDASADLVVIALALAHVEDLGPVFAECARVLRPGGHLVVSDSRGHFVGSALYPLVKETPDGRTGYLPTWQHGIGEYVRVALAHGFEVRACEEPPRPPLDPEDAEPVAPPAPGEPADVWSLMDVVPEATWATYLGRPALVVWDFQLAGEPRG